MAKSDSLIGKDSCNSHNINSMSLLRYYADYYEYVSSKYSSKYLRSITTLFNHVFKHFGKNRFLNEIEYREWDRFFLQLNNRCPGGAPVYLRTMKAALNVAKEWGLISENPLIKVKLPRRQRKEQKSLSVDEMNSIRDAVNNPQLKDLIYTGYFTGLRLSELINLKVKHIDLDAGFLTVGDDKIITKSRRIREVALSDPLKELLEHKIINLKPEDLLFGKTKRFPYSADYVSRTFKKAVRRKRLNNQIHFHSLRHSFITILANSEVPLPTVQRLAGHSNITTTMGYVHVNRMDLLKSVNVLNSLN